LIIYRRNDGEQYFRGPAPKRIARKEPPPRRSTLAGSFDRQWAGRKDADVSALLISNKSSCVNARTLPIDAGPLA
jgi:hypothetical protein